MSVLLIPDTSVNQILARAPTTSVQATVASFLTSMNVRPRPLPIAQQIHVAAIWLEVFNATPNLVFNALAGAVLGKTSARMLKTAAHSMTSTNVQLTATNVL